MMVEYDGRPKMLLKVQDGNDAFIMWWNLLNVHETLDKGRACYVYKLSH